MTVSQFISLIVKDLPLFVEFLPVIFGLFFVASVPYIIRRFF